MQMPACELRVSNEMDDVPPQACKRCDFFARQRVKKRSDVTAMWQQSSERFYCDTGMKAVLRSIRKNINKMIKKLLMSMKKSRTNKQKEMADMTAMQTGTILIAFFKQHVVGRESKLSFDLYCEG